MSILGPAAFLLFLMIGVVVGDEPRSLLVDCIKVLTRRGKLHPDQHIYISTLGSGRDVDFGMFFKIIPKVKQSYSYSIHNTCLNKFLTPPSMYMFCTKSSDPNAIHTEMKNHIALAKCRHDLWYPHSRIIIILESGLCDEKWLGIAEEIIRIMWKNIIYNTAVFITDPVRNIGSLYIADPFHPNNGCGRNLSNVQVMRQCPRDKASMEAVEVKFLSKKALFPNCTLKVSVRDSIPFSYFIVDNKTWIGPDINFLKELGSRVGLTYELIDRTLAYNISMGEDSLYPDVMKNNIDVAVSGPEMRNNYYYNVTYLRSHSTQYLSFYVPSPSILDRIHVFHMSFDPQVWIAVLLVSLACWVFLLFTGWRKSVMEKLFFVYALNLQQTNSLPNNTSLRIFTAVFLIGTYLYSSMYTSNLHSLTVNPPYEPPLNTWLDLQNRHYTALSSEQTKRIVDTLDIKLISFKLFLKNIKPYENIYDALKMMHLYRNVSILERDVIMKYAMLKNSYNFHKFPKDLTHVKMAFLVPKGSLFSKRFNSFMSRCVEHGLYNKWINDLVPYELKNIKKLSSENLKVLSVGDLYPAFLILLAGHVLSFMVFLCEILHHKTKIYFK